MLDLRSFLDLAGKAGELIRVTRETDPLTEMGALFGETEHPLLFERVRGYPGWEVCGELATSRAAQALALQVERSQVVPELLGVCRKVRSPHESSTAGR